MRKYKILGGYGLLALVLDQLTKWWAVAAIDPLQPVTVIPGLLDLVLVHNRGAAFGFLNRSDIQWQFWLFLGATVVAAVAIVALLRSSRFNAWLSAGLGLVLGGALGNLVDRVRFRAVRSGGGHTGRPPGQGPGLACQWRDESLQPSRQTFQAAMPVEAA